MDAKIFYERIDLIEKKIRDLKSETKELKVFADSLTFPSNTCDSDVNKMFDEKYRIEYALILARNKRKVAAKILRMSERNLFRLISEYNIK